MNINYHGVKAATVTVSATSESYNFSANVSYTANEVLSISEGYVTATADPSEAIAHFNVYSPSEFSITFHTEEDEAKITTDVKAFIASVREKGADFSIAIK